MDNDNKSFLFYSILFYFKHLSLKLNLYTKDLMIRDMELRKRK